MTATREDIVRVARSYMGTKFEHMGRTPGVGLDCAGVLICVARELGIVAPGFDVPAYQRRPDGSLLRWCDEHMTRVERWAAREGDVIVVAVEEDPQHLGILYRYSEKSWGIIHAYCRPNGTGQVTATRLLFSQSMRYVATYSMLREGA